ncbi:MAG: HemK2/MTQ2 family protein methyltransferase [Candidatus Odinarchaeia archaeon]
MGTGTGYIAIKIAPKVKSVIASDINPKAVKCAKINIRLNKLEDKIKVIQSNLFDTIPKTEFHSIIFNPPYILGKPNKLVEKSWLSENPIRLIEKFIEQSKAFLKNKGLIQIGYSTIGPLKNIIKKFQNNGYKLRRVAEKKIMWETIKVLIFQKITDL